MFEATSALTELSSTSSTLPDSRGRLGRERLFCASSMPVLTTLQGSDNVKVEPMPGALRSVTAPPSISASWREMARPRPVPPKRRDAVLSA
jgi:hypothetical protein